MHEEHSTPAPLEGVRVLDLSRILAGPFCAMMLADLGAEVIKIETPWGDDSREFGPFWNGDSAYYRLFNRSKQGITLDLKNPTDVETFTELARRADVVVENFRPGVMDRLGIGPQELLKANPSLIITSISGFGQQGSFRELPAYDLVAQALSGLMSVTGPVGGPATRTGVSLGDLVPGLYATIATLAALRQREATGRGQHIDIAMYDSLVSILESVAMRSLHTDEDITAVGNDHAMTVPFSTYRVSDGDVVIAVSNAKLFERLAPAIGIEYMLEDSRYATNEARVARREEVRQLIEQAIANETVASLTAKLQQAGVPCAHVASVDEALHGPLGQERSVLATEADGFVTLASPLKIHGMRPPTPAPQLGQHNGGIGKLLTQPPKA
ncbi:CaiB/BaiF CoA transferase family protein [Corynebacterium lizhenjunii]|uniref:CaiB/BaiF CoA transferase family protein n=1 Tax=Corynebacterium lizhenjunii TaxID=2709394 RepID=UPI0013ECC073|nr:CoA transferase [Corynebacterium lizhenjunii]